MFQLILALFIIGIGLSVAGLSTHLYQGLSRQMVEFRWDGNSAFEAIGYLFLSFICGPYIMLRLGWRNDSGRGISTVSALLASFIAFGWSFFTGLMIMGTYVAVRLAA